MPHIRLTIPAELPPAETIDPKEVLDAYLKGDIDCICVLGPTASGKTRYAAGLCRRFNEILGEARAEIISADSRQVYRGMDIGTGKDICEYGEIPFHLIDIVPAGSKYNVYSYQKDFADAYKDVRSRGCIPVLCGGSGLYIEAATCGYRFAKEVPQVSPDELPAHTFYIGTLVTREVRNQRIDARLRARLEEGMVEEIRGLMDSGVAAEDLIFYGLEYKFVTQHVLGELSAEEMYTLLSNAIHQFAKRQMTWFRGMERDGVVIHWTEV